MIKKIRHILLMCLLYMLLIPSTVYAADEPNWKEWYDVARKVARGETIPAETSDDTFETLYQETLAYVGSIRSSYTQANAWRRVYDIMCLASLNPEQGEVVANKDGELWFSYTHLEDVYKRLTELVTGASSLGTNVSSLKGYKEELNEGSSNTTDNEVRLADTFYARMLLLYDASINSNLDLAGTDAWITAWYEAGDTARYTLNDELKEMFKGNDDLFKDQEDIILLFDGTDIDSMPNFAKVDANAPFMPYMMQTIMELPYITRYMLPGLDSALTNSAVDKNLDMFRILEEIHTAVETFNIGVLNKLWEFEYDDWADNYKSLKAVYEAYKNSAEAQDAADSSGSTEDKKLTSGQPLGWFFENYMTGQLHENYMRGLAYSATMVPMKTNLYSEEFIQYLDMDFYIEFYSLWGFNRKALFIDKTAGAGEAYFTTNNTSRGDLKVCTLRDLIESEGDVVLYLDDDFYNADALSDIEASPTVSVASSEEEVDTSEIAAYGDLAERIERRYNTSMENIVKDGNNTNYSKTFYELMSQVDKSHEYFPNADLSNPGNEDAIVLTSGSINYYLSPEQAGSEIYSPLQGFAVVSSIYRDGDLFNIANSSAVQKPVFIASNTAPYMAGASNEAKQTIFNYALIRNLKAAMPVNYSGNLDMDCPVYMDIFGNILTESGTVVVPALSNATLWNPNDYYKQMWSAGLFAIYGLEYRIPADAQSQKALSSVMATAFAPDQNNRYYVVRPRTLGDTYKADMSRLSTTSKDTLDLLYNMSYSNLYNSTHRAWEVMDSIEVLDKFEKTFYDFDSYFQICVEVLRGAPMENIDKTVEGLETTARLDKTGIVAAAKLEELNKSLGTNGENTSIYLPNIAFMPGFNFVTLMAFKIMLLVVIFVNMVTIYFDAVSESMGLGTLWKCFAAMMVTALTILTVPTLFEITYYHSNRALLQEEAIYISMLNLEKEASGVEIGVTEVKEPEINTELFLKLEEVKVPWYDLIYNSMYTSTYHTFNELYADYAEKHTVVAYEDDVQVKNDGVYVDVNDIYNSSSVDLDMSVTDPNVRMLVQTAIDPSQTFSYYSPYYAILDALIRNVNYYNQNPWGEDRSDSDATQGWYSYTTKNQKGGKLKTMGIIEPYFTSSRFMELEGSDILGLREIYKDISPGVYTDDPATYELYSAENREAIKNAYWYPQGITEEELNKRIEYLHKEARMFVANNRDLIGKISDDTFLKAMAMDLAVKHNKAFSFQKASSFELYNLSSDDLIRLSIADRENVMLNSTLSYPRFVYTVGGTPTTYAAAVLSMVMWLSGLLKPALVVVAFLTIFVSVFIFRVCMRKEGTSLYGYVITTLLLGGTNILYSLLLKLSMYLPTLGLTPFMCVILNVLVQIVYLVVLLSVVATAFKDWRDLGFARYANKLQDWRVSLFNWKHRDKSNATNPFYGGTTKKSDPEKNWNYYDDMMDERRKRGR